MASALEGTVEQTALVPVESHEQRSIAAFASPTNYDAAKRMASALAQSSLVPKDYQGTAGIANCLVAMELASRTGASVLMVMQNLHVIQGRPSWSATFLVASINACGKFSPLRYEIRGDDPAKDDYAVRAYAFDLATGDKLEGEWITWAMVKAEGWLSKAGSKWKTMPGQMFRYRAASFWARVYAPEVSLGMHTADEMEDVTGARSAGPSAAARSLQEAIKAEVRIAETGEQSGLDAQNLKEDAETVAAEENR